MLSFPAGGGLVVQQSLFDDLDTQAENGSPPGTRRVGAPPGERAAWEAWKSSLLPGFVAPYGRALAASRLHRACWWVDGLDAAGRALLGSAAAAFAETADSLAALGFALHGLRLVSERPKSKRAEAPAAEAVSASGSARKTHPARQPADTETRPTVVAREDVLATLGTAPAVLLLNPLAAPPLAAEDLLALCQRQAPTELLLTISAARLTQLAEEGLAAQAAPAPEQGRPAHDAPHPLTALLRSDAWKAIWSGPEKTPAKVQRTLELLRGLLKPRTLYVCLTALDEAPTPAPRRFLLFASRQYASVALLNDFLCAERARLAHERETRALQGSWFAKRRAAARAAAWAALKEEMHTLGRLRRARLWPDLKPLLLLDHFGQFSSADHDAALLELVNEGRVGCRWSPEISPAETGAASDTPPAARVPGPQDFLEFLEAKPRPVWRR